MIQRSLIDLQIRKSERHKFFLSFFSIPPLSLQHILSSSLSMAEQEVTYEDQQKINKFGRLTQKLHELEAQQRSAEKKKLNIQDASTEMMLADEGMLSI